MQAAEDKLVARIAKAFAPKHLSRLTLGVGDDAALFTARPGFQTILTCDWFLEGTHFLPGKHPADSIGWKALARAVSDVAAMGGQPKCFLLSLALPKRLTGTPKGLAWLDDFLAGMSRAARRFHCALAGGDTTQRPEILINITVVGEVSTGRAVLRSGARPGDLIFVSGTLGEADLGLELVRRKKRTARHDARILQKHLYPQPRLALGAWLANHNLATSMMDLSDGLSSDLPRLCAASGVGGRIDAADIPTPKIPETAPNRRFDSLMRALNSGDDYELLFTVRENNAHRIPRSFKGLKVTPIGEITRDRKIILQQPDGTSQPLLPRGWDPFRK